MKLKSFIAGLLAGIMVMVAVPALADSERVTALIDRTIKVQIAGEVKTLPPGYEVLTYDNRTYLPTRYVAETLGSTVTWNESTRWITISEVPVKEVEVIKEVPVEVEKIVYVEKDTSYQELSASASKGNISMTVKNISRIASFQNTSSTRLSCEVKNASNSEGSINVYYGDATLTVDGKTYNMANMPSGYGDDGFYDDIRPGNTYDGYFYFPLIDAGTKNFIFTVPVRNQASGDMTTLTIRFSATLEKDD